MLAHSKEGVLDTFTISHLGATVYNYSIWPLTSSNGEVEEVEVCEREST